MEKTKLEKENDKNAIALFKFAIVAPLVNNNYDYKSKEEFYRIAALKKYTLPNGKETILTAGTIKRWFIEYKNNGFDALKPRTRTDAGLSRKIPAECINKVEEIKEQYPHITGKGIYTKLIENGDILTKNVSLASLYRFLNNNHFHTHNKPERKAFEMEFANDCWQRRHITWANNNYRWKKGSNILNPTNR